jgi:predicted NBD/HSP70 family sugar kinase
MYILFDVGGTKIRVAGSSNFKDLDKIKKTNNPGSFKEGVDVLLSLIKETVNGEKIEGIAGGIAGSYSKKEGKLLASPNMKDWVNKPFEKILQKKFNIPLYIDNDAAMAVIGESKRGAGKKYEIVGYITVSTGIGGSRAVNGLVDKRAVTYEPGHQIIKISGEKIETLENLASGKSLKEKFGKEPYEIKNKEIWDELAEYLGIGLYNTILHWSPDVMILGGPMIIKNPSISFEKVKKKVKNLLGAHYCPEIKKSKLGDEVSLYGALEYLKSLKD